MQGLQVEPDAFALNSLLAQSLARLRKKPSSSSSSSSSSPQAAVQTIKDLMSAHASLSPNVNTFRAVLNACGVERYVPPTHLFIHTRMSCTYLAVQPPTYSFIIPFIHPPTHPPNPGCWSYVPLSRR